MIVVEISKMMLHERFWDAHDFGYRFFLHDFGAPGVRNKSTTARGGAVGPRGDLMESGANQ